MSPDKMEQLIPEALTPGAAATGEMPVTADRKINLRLNRRSSLEDNQNLPTAGLVYRLQRQMIKAMTRVAEARDLYLFSHQSRVAYLAKSIAVRLGVAPEQAEGIYYAGLLHDIGKICVPGEILCKTSKLNADEIGIVRRHCDSGYEILKDIEFTWPIAAVARQHHERLNGSGYPQGLAQDEILMAAKIVAVADVVEAMASARPYRPPLGVAFALNEVATNKGILYEPDVVAVCLELFASGFSFQMAGKHSR